MSKSRGRLGALGAALVVSAITSAVPVTAQTPIEIRAVRKKAIRMVAGAARVNITPFTLTKEVEACRADPECPYRPILRLSRLKTSNKDGLPGGLFEKVGSEMAAEAASADWIGPAGMWGEAYDDANANGRFDQGETFTDDPANESPVVAPGHPSPLGDAASSSGKYDGAYMGGYGSDRMALGAFDPIWVRALYLRDRKKDVSMAWVSIDTTGYFSDFLGRIRDRVPDKLEPEHILLTHTHDHEGVDHVGLWGQDIADDGTYPRYDIYVEAKIAQAITKAVKRARGARFRFGWIGPGTNFVTPRGNTERLDGMMSRNSCRLPWFFDQELRAMQVVRAGSKKTIASLINWGAHVESMDARNQYLSSDLTHTARRTLEKELGGVSMYAPSAQGAAEIIGDSCTARWQRDTFDGERFPVDENGDPAAFGADPYDPLIPKRRTYAIGRVLGAAALAALEDAPLDSKRTGLKLLGPELMCFPVNNEGLLALAAAGVIDKPLTSSECPAEDQSSPDRAKTNLYAFKIGSGSFVTAPGEVQPELYYGVKKFRRAAALGDYEDPNGEAFDCAARSHHDLDNPGAHSDRPYEPSIRDAQKARFKARVNFLIGYTPDLLGYVVPGYDFYWFGGPGGFGLPVEQVADPCAQFHPDTHFPDALYETHYQETNSAGSMLAPAVACEIIRLLGDPLKQGDSQACEEWDTTNLTGRPPDQPPPFGREPGCFTGPEPPSDACLIRHY